MHSLIQDIRFALRSLLKNPSFAIVAIVSLALGIGASTSMFSVIYAVLLDPVPYADWQRLADPVLIDDTQPGAPHDWFVLNAAQFQEFIKAKSLDSVIGFTNRSAEVTGHELPEDLHVTYMTENASDFLRVPPLLGRNLQMSDADVSGHQPPVVLNYEFWMRHYDGDRNVIGQVLEIDHHPFTIVGVMPSRDTFDLSDAYVPVSLLPSRDRNLMPYMKLKQGVSLAAANAEIDAILHQFAKERPDLFPKKFHTHIEHLTDGIVDTVGHALEMLFAAVLILLVIGCANCSILLLARGMVRRNEIAVRTALGASRSRIVRQLLVEALVLAISGSAIGIFLAWGLARTTFQLFPDIFLHESVVRINLPILAFCVATAMASGLLFGLLPSLRMSRPDVSRVIQSGARRIAGRDGQTRSLNTLIAAQIALTVVMMGAAGAAIEGFIHLMHRNYGYDPSHVMAVPVPLHRNSALTREQRAAYFDTLQQKIATVPGVTQVAIGANATPPSSGWSMVFEILGQPLADQQHLRANMVGPGYFATLRIPLLSGRLWDESENNRAAALAVINQALARRYFPKGDAIGRQLRVPGLAINAADAQWVVGSPDSGGWLQIVGVVADSANDGPDHPVQPAVYFPSTRFIWMQTQFLVRTHGTPLSALRDVRLAIQSVNPDQQTARNVRDLEELMEQEPAWRQQRLFSILFGAFSALALLLALLGLYSVISYSVAQRTNEFGIRMALGAQRSHVLWIVTRNVFITVAGGIAAGLAIYLPLQPLLLRWAQNSSGDPRILIAAVFLFLASAAAACIGPALRAASVDPMEALRYE